MDAFLSLFVYCERVLMAPLQMKLVFVFKINAVLYISLILCLGGNEVRLFLNFDNLRFFPSIIGANTPKIGHAPVECMIV